MADQSITLDAFLAKHDLPQSYRESANTFFLPLARTIVEWGANHEGAQFIGINGAQGTGKSTLADFFKEVLAAEFGKRCAVLSIDDFYLTKTERERLAVSVHPLLKTRGVPGTHDIALANRVLHDLKTLKKGERYSLPRFDKSVDDRAPVETWESVDGPVDIVFLEGWCVGSVASDNESLDAPMNALEQTEDSDGVWRQYVNERLAGPYAALFAQLDRLCFLKAPNFDAIVRWRTEQEHKLRQRTGAAGVAVMSDQEILRFIQHYERITVANLEDLPRRADVMITLGTDHRAMAMEYRRSSEPLAPHLERR
ncbi:MAG: kinase [Pseudomonadota bacterium]